jgi:hypothetical protein
MSCQVLLSRSTTVGNIADDKVSRMTAPSGRVAIACGFSP